jgi:hypothetical protein
MLQIRSQVTLATHSGMSDEIYFGSLRASGPVYDHILEFLKRNHGRKLREVMDAEIDISDVMQLSRE